MGGLRAEPLTVEQFRAALSAPHSIDQVYDHARALGHEPKSFGHALAILHVVGKVPRPELALWLQKSYVSSMKTRVLQQKPTEQKIRTLIDLAHYHAVEQWSYIVEAIDAFKRDLRSAKRKK